MRRGRRALVLTATAYAVGLVWSALVLPARVPAHFDASGQVDGWTSRTAMLAFWVVLGVVVLAGIPALTRLVTRGDGTWVNLPPRSKDYWFAPERREEFRARFGDDIEGFSALTGALMTAVMAITTWVGATGRSGVPWWAHRGVPRRDGRVDRAAPARLPTARAGLRPGPRGRVGVATLHPPARCPSRASARVMPVRLTSTTAWHPPSVSGRVGRAWRAG